MKRFWLPLFMLAFFVSLLFFFGSFSASAEMFFTIKFDDVELKDGYYLSSGQTVPTNQKPQDHFAGYADGVLTLQNFTFSGQIQSDGDCVIKLAGETVLTPESWGIFCGGTLELAFEEGASLRVDTGLGLYALDSVLITGGKLSVADRIKASDQGFVSVSDCVLSAGSLITDQGDVMLFSCDVTGGSIRSSRGGVLISQSDLNVEGPYSIDAQAVGITLSYVTMNVSGDAILAEKSVIVDRSSVEITALTGIDSGGLIVSDSTMEVVSTQKKLQYIKSDYAIKGSIFLGEGLYGLGANSVGQPLGILEGNGAYKMDHVKIVKELNLYTVTFDSDGGTPFASQKVYEGHSVVQPTLLPQKDGYVFRWWQLNGEEFSLSTPVNGDITLVALWKPAAGTESTDLPSETVSSSDDIDPVESDVSEPISSSEIFVNTDWIDTDETSKTTSSDPVQVVADDGSRIRVLWIVLPIVGVLSACFLLLLLLKKRK